MLNVIGVICKQDIQEIFTNYMHLWCMYFNENAVKKRIEKRIKKRIEKNTNDIDYVIFKFL